MKKSVMIAAVGTFLLAAIPALAQWKDTPAIKQIYEAAKKEGAVTIWGPQIGEVDWIPKALAAEFPGIDVKFFGDNDYITKVIAEARAGKNDVDIIWGTLGGSLPLVQRDMLAKVDWSMFGVLPGNVAYDGRGGMTNNAVYCVIYRADKVSDADVPKTWTDLLQPKFKGKMVASSFLLPRMIAFLGLEWGEDKALQFARDVMQTTDVLVTRAPRNPFLQSGERLYTIAEPDTYHSVWSAQGLPVKMVIPEPVAVVQYLGTVLDKAPHPNAARLLAGWLASSEGKRAREKAIYHIDYRPGSENPRAKALHASGAKLIFEDPTNMAMRDQLVPKLNAIVSGQAR